MMFGEIGAWFFKGLGGIKPDERQPGFKNVLLEPHFVQGLDHFEMTFDGPYGKIESRWKRNGKRVAMEVVVPANSTATLLLPDGEQRELPAVTHAMEWRDKIGRASCRERVCQYV